MPEDLDTGPERLATAPSGDAASDCNVDQIPMRPHLLPAGTWGVLAVAPLAVSDLAIVPTSCGEQWNSKVPDLLDPIPLGIVARSTGRPQHPR